MNFESGAGASERQEAGATGDEGPEGGEGEGDAEVGGHVRGDGQRRESGVGVGQVQQPGRAFRRREAAETCLICSTLYQGGVANTAGRGTAGRSDYCCRERTKRTSDAASCCEP